MAKSPSEQIRELNNQLSTLTERLDNARDENRELKLSLSKLDEKCGKSEEKIASLTTRLELVQQHLDDHLKRVEIWEGRRWGLISLLIGATLSLAAGLIVTLVKK